MYPQKKTQNNIYIYTVLINEFPYPWHRHHFFEMPFFILGQNNLIHPPEITSLDANSEVLMSSPPPAPSFLQHPTYNKKCWIFVLLNVFRAQWTRQNHRFWNFFGGFTVLNGPRSLWTTAKTASFWQPPPKTNMSSEKILVGRLLSFWNAPFLEDMLVFGGVVHLVFQGEIDHS